MDYLRTIIDETKPLLKKRSTQYTKWYQKLFKWPFNVIWFGVLLLGAVYVLYIFMNNDIQSDSSNVPKNKPSLHIKSIATTNDDFLKKCAPIVKCDPNAKYRSINGSCNNLKTPTWGAAATPFLRLLDANFSDGYYSLRVQTNGSELPYPRVLDVNIFLNREIYRVDENNVLLLPFGQLIAHDISGLPNDLVSDENGAAIDCCLTENKIKNYTQCQIVLENLPDDPVYGVHNKTCSPIFRSLTSRNYSCPLYPTTFINDNSHFIDASEVYGSSESYALHLRTMVGGRLKFSIGDNGQMFCPFLTDQNKASIGNKKTHIKYDTGDPDNGNQNFGITAMQTLFLRFHNYIAFKLSSLNPFWSDEIIYQESRRIVIATIQRISYEDFLPIIIGKDFQETYGLNEANIYDSTINPSTSLEFSSAGSRVLHAIIPVEFNFVNKDYKIDNSIKITDWMVKADLIPLGDNFDKLLKGFIETPGRMAQPSYNFYISNYMLTLPNNPSYNGRDLLAVDIARGRDVGLQPYNQVRHLCGFPLAKDFEDLADLIHIKDVMKLKKNYYSVNDIDLMVGILLEKLSDGAIVGPTAQCLIADGFYRYKAGDRFFYDVQGQPSSFTDDQLKVIKKITLGHVICATSNVDHVQKDIFKTVDHNLFPTIKMKCDEEFNLNFKAWEEVNYHPEL
ncbi:peroxidase [Acyrthosiphon pisum]|uniref:Peroxidase n=1 Tax=Acyrthosiphon pisum TaxID=7029 RepID=A0A8R1W221_ACYPI|nr:peroxidase [Acyrthosiphon pisum]|eukprot:XP_001944613.1 PREDICTED: peroxidase [Acyrthosiphon pisum]